MPRKKQDNLKSKDKGNFFKIKVNLKRYFAGIVDNILIYDKERKTLSRTKENIKDRR